MKAISLWEPWASLIRTGAKTYETRSWATKYRGPLLICASIGGLCDGKLMKLVASAPFQLGLAPLIAGTNRPIVTRSDLNNGKAVAVALLADCVPTKSLPIQEIGSNMPFGDFSPGRFAWKLEKIRAIDPFPVKGHQGLFNIYTGCDNCGDFHSSCFGAPDNTDKCTGWKPVSSIQLLRVRVPSATLKNSLKLNTLGRFYKKPSFFFLSSIYHFLSIFFTFYHYFSYKLHTVRPFIPFHIFWFAVIAEIEKYQVGGYLRPFFHCLKIDSFDLQCRVHGCESMLHG